MKPLFFCFLFTLFMITGCSLFQSEHYITTPSDKQNVSGVQNIYVTPPANFSVDSVKFFVDSVYKYMASSSPYTYQWDTRVYTNGPHLLSIEMYSVSGQMLTDAITVYVGN